MRLGIVISVFLALVVCGCKTPRARSLVRVEIRLAQNTAAPGLIRIRNPAYRKRASARVRIIDKYYFMHPTAVLTKEDIVRADVEDVRHVSFDKKAGRNTSSRIGSKTSRPAVSFRLTWSGARRLSKALKANARTIRISTRVLSSIGPPDQDGQVPAGATTEIKVSPSIVIIVNGRPSAVMAVKGKIRRRLLITANFSEEEAVALASALNGTPLPEGMPFGGK